MKKVLILLVALMMVVIGCNKSQPVIESNYALYGFPAQSDKGIYHNIQNAVYLYDFESDKDYPLCTKENCNHNQDSCDAYQLAKYKDLRLGLQVMYANEHLYYVYEDTALKKAILCVSDETGANRKELLELPTGIVISMMIYHNKVYFSIYNYDFDDESKVVYNTYIYDLNNQKLAKIDVPDYICYQYLGVVNDQIIVTKINYEDEENTVMSNVTLNEELKEVSQIPTQEANLFVYGKKSVYMKDNIIYEYNYETNESKKAVEIATEKGSKFDVRINICGIVQIIEYRNQQFYKQYYYDLNSAKLVEGDNNIIAKHENNYIVEDSDGRYKKQ